MRRPDSLRRRAGLVGLGLLLVVGGTGYAGDPPSPPPPPAPPTSPAAPASPAPPASVADSRIVTPEERAVEVRAAIAAGDSTWLADLAARSDPSAGAVLYALFALALEATPTGTLGAEQVAPLLAYVGAVERAPTGRGLGDVVRRWAAMPAEAVDRERRFVATQKAMRAAFAAKKPVEALAAAQAARADVEAAPDAFGAFAVLRETGATYIKLGRAVDAARAFHEAAVVGRRAGHLVGAAIADLQSAQLLVGSGEDHAALERAQAALEAFEGMGLARPAMRCRIAMGRARCGLSQPAAAEADARAIVAHALATRDDELEAEALGLLANAQVMSGDDRAADASYERALAIYQGHGAYIQVAETLTAWANALVHQERWSEAIEAHERLVAIFTERKYVRGLVVSESQLSRVYGVLYRAEESLRHAERAVKAAEATGVPEQIELARQTLGSALSRAGRNQRALEVLREVEAARLARGDRLGAAYTRTRISDAEYYLGRVDDALASARRSVEEFEALGFPVPAASARGLVPGLLHMKGDFDGFVRASEAYAEAVDRLPSRDGVVVTARRRLAETRLLTHRPAEALALVQSILPLERRGDGSGLAESEVLGLRVLRRATTDLGVCAALDLAADPVRRQAAAEAAFGLAEAGRARLLAAGLANAAGLLASRLPPDLLAEDVDSRRRLDQARAAVVSASGAEGTQIAEKARKALAAAWKRRDEVIDRIQRADRKASAWVEPPAPSLGTLRAALPPSTAVVLYQVLDFDPELRMPRRVAAVVVRSNAVHLVEIPDEDGLMKDVDAWLRLASTPGSDDTVLAARLGARLFAPVEPALEGATSLVIIPDGELTFVPFEALVRTGEDRAQRLVERYEMTYAPSVGVWLALAAEDAPRGTRVLAIGDPTPPGGDEGGGRGALPESADEARAVVGFVSEGLRSLLLGRSASVEGVLSAIEAAPSRLRALHFACHGVVDPVRARGSGLLLADGDVLDVDRLARARVPADLVVLSACESARGKVAQGEGVYGLPRAFLLAGVPRVIASQWTLSDQATRPFMVRFHDGYLGQRLSAPAALRAAKLSALGAGGASAHPSAWAPFVLWGRAD